MNRRILLSIVMIVFGLWLGVPLGEEGRIHVVQSGDTLYRIATTNQLTVDEVKEINSLTSSTVFVGQRLQVSEDTNYTYLSVTQRETLESIATRFSIPFVELKQLNGSFTTTVSRGDLIKLKEKNALTPPSNESGFQEYTVQRGDILRGIATLWNVTEEAIRQWNNLPNDSIQPGQILNIQSPNKFFQVIPTSGSYVIKTGDTLCSISDRFGITTHALLTWNNLQTSVFNVGQNIRVKDESVTSPTNPPSSLFPPPALPSPPPTLPPPSITIPQQGSRALPTNVQAITVGKGDTMASVSKRYGITEQKIRELNNLKTDVLIVGQHLTLNLSTLGEDALTVGLQQMGVPYLFGGTSPRGFDCSGFIFYTNTIAGLQFSRMSVEGYWMASRPVTNPKKGDLIFFQNTYKVGPSHMGIILGDGTFLHADATRGIKIDSISLRYYKERFLGYGTFK